MSMTVAEFRKKTRAAYPHVTVRVRTVSFAECWLGFGSAKCLTLEGERSVDELRIINDWAKDAGILRDGAVHFYKG